MSEPMPGVANWFSSAALRALAWLILFGAKNGFIRKHHPRDADGGGEQHADAAAQNTGEAHEAHQNRQAENLPPVLAHHFEAGLHRRAKIHLLDRKSVVPGQ